MSNFLNDNLEQKNSQSIDRWNELSKTPFAGEAKSNETATPENENNWSKSGTTNAGEYVLPSGTVDTNSEVTLEQIENANKDNQGFDPSEHRRWKNLDDASKRKEIKALLDSLSEEQREYLKSTIYSEYSFNDDNNNN